jgi:hypothetical protein
MIIEQRAEARRTSGDVLQQQQYHRQSGRQLRPIVVAEQRRDLIVNPAAVDNKRQAHQPVLQVDDLIEPRRQDVLLSHLALVPDS